VRDWIVYDGNDMPDRVLIVKYTINKDARYPDLGAIVSRSKENLARGIAQKIVEGKTFFNVEESTHGPFIEISGSCVVLTLEEYKRKMEDQFKRGMDCAAGMAPDTWCKL